MTTVKEQDAKQRILAAATELFSQKGFDATGVSEIAKEAQVNKALIYYYFENKEAILDSLIDAMLSNVSTLTLKFARECLGPMIQAGTLRLEDERFLLPMSKHWRVLAPSCIGIIKRLWTTHWTGVPLSAS